MTRPASTSTDPAIAERDRVADGFRARLRSRGITLHSTDTLAELGLILESVEEFELQVESHGGDLMVDEPPVGHTAQPDDPAFVLPVRHTGESPTWFANRIQQARYAIQRQAPEQRS